MPDEVTTAPAAVLSEAAPSGVASNASVGGSAPSPAPRDLEEPHWLPERLDRAKKNAVADALKALGVDSLDAAKSMLKAAKALEEAQKTEAQKTADKVATLEAENKELPALRAAVKAHADAAMKELKHAQRAMVERLAGDDPAKQLETIGALREGGAFAKGVDLENEINDPRFSGSPPKTIAPPAQTTGASAAPKPAPSQRDTDHLAKWEQLKQVHPMAAAKYLIDHQAAIRAAQEAKSK